MAKVLSNISVIIPLAPQDKTWEKLLCDLELLGASLEVIVVGPEKPKNFVEMTQMFQNLKCSWVDSPLGRAQQMNLGAQLAQGSYLWFLHADTRVSRQCFRSLEKSLLNHPKRLHYFCLKFAKDGPPWMWINSIGANFRSGCFHMPWGDQGFCVSKNQFEILKGFNETVKFAEDHDFVLRWRKQGSKLKMIPSFLVTSARKYKAQGWGKTTIYNIKYWYKNRKASL